jgi:hypothetical protein
VTKTLAKYGVSVSFQTFSSETPQQGTGTVTQAGEASVSVLATPPFNYSHMLIDGEVIKDGDVAILIAGENLTFTPYVGQQVTIDSLIWRTEAVTVHKSGLSVAAYELRLRRAAA